jgi:glycosyltransferase involved in cell wall biosynthesis
MRKLRILIQTNPPWLKTGLAEAGKVLMQYLYGLNKYDLAWYCTQVSEADPMLQTTPWKSYGALPSDPRLIQELNQDPGKARNAAYGAYNIDKVIKDFKPDILWGADDLWSFGLDDYMKKEWWKHVNGIMHITIDSIPVLEQAFEQAKLTKHYYTWAKFAMKEMHKFGPDYAHIKHIYGASNTKDFCPISDQERLALRQRFNISPNTVIFNYVFRNQLRKRALLLLKAFAEFKKENPTADAKLHLHTSVAEMGAGWNLPKMMAYYGVKNEDVLFTYVCKICGQWHISPYVGEDIKCPYCGVEKAMITTNIVHGVPGNEMKYVYGLADACLSPSNSGGLELCCPQALLCGKPLASTNYASGQDFCEQDFVHSLRYVEDNEPGTNFIKAVPSVEDMKRFMKKVHGMSRKDLERWGQRGREWALKTFPIEVIGPQWESVFDSCERVDWDKVNMTPAPKNDTFPFPQIDDADAFITTLYVNILKMDEPPQGEGRRHWHAQLKAGMTRQQVYDYFIGVARQENTKNQVASQDFSALLDKTGRKRGLLVVKESLGDCLMMTQLFESFHEQYPDHDLYVACDPKFAEVFAGNPHVHKVLPYQPFMEQEMACIGAGQKKGDGLFDVYMHPGILTQRQLFYLSS